MVTHLLALSVSGKIIHQYSSGRETERVSVLAVVGYQKGKARRSGAVRLADSVHLPDVHC